MKATENEIEESLRGHWRGVGSLVSGQLNSGKKRGTRSIRGGRSTVRRALYICAWSVLRVEGDMRHFYRRLRRHGKLGKVALVAVARKLLLQLNALARRGTSWVDHHKIQTAS